MASTITDLTAMVQDLMSGDEIEVTREMVQEHMGSHRYEDYTDDSGELDALCEAIRDTAASGDLD